VSVATAWIAADSPIQRRADVDLQKRKHFLVTGALTAAISADVVRLSMPMVAAADLNVPAEMSPGRFRYRYLDLDRMQYLPFFFLLGVPERQARVEVTVTQAGQESIRMNVRARPLWQTSHPGIWTQMVTVEVAYGHAATVEFPGDTPDRTMRLLLRVERLNQ
jgi:hypothetical protein